MSALNTPITFDFRTNTFDATTVSTEIAALRSCSLAFQNLLASIPSQMSSTQLPGGPLYDLNSIVITDRPTAISLIDPVRADADPAVSVFNASGVLYVYLNPRVFSVVGDNQSVDTVAGRIIHEFAHYTPDALAEPRSQIPVIEQENVVRESLGLPLRTPADLQQDHTRDGGPTFLYRNSPCFVAGTSVLMADGSEKAIENIRPGDLVLAFDGEIDRGRGSLNSRRVVRSFTNVTDEWLVLRPTGVPSSDFVDLTVTPGHRFLTPQGHFCRIDDILSHDSQIVLSDGSIAAITAERIAYSAETAHCYEEAVIAEYRFAGGLALAPQLKKGWKTYNLEVEGLHTYVAGGTRVHNDCAVTLVVDSDLFAAVYGRPFAGTQEDFDQLLGGIANGEIPADGQFVDPSSQDRFTGSFDTAPNRIVISADPDGTSLSTVSNEFLQSITSFPVNGTAAKGPDLSGDRGGRDGLRVGAAPSIRRAERSSRCRSPGRRSWCCNRCSDASKRRAHRWSAWSSATCTARPTNRISPPSTTSTRGSFRSTRRRASSCTCRRGPDRSTSKSTAWRSFEGKFTPRPASPRRRTARASSSLRRNRGRRS